MCQMPGSDLQFNSCIRVVRISLNSSCIIKASRFAGTDLSKNLGLPEMTMKAIDINGNHLYGFSYKGRASIIPLADLLFRRYSSRVKSETATFSAFDEACIK